MLRIEFEYCDKLSHYTWRKQTCIVPSLDMCINLYGLDKDPDCKYKIIKIEEV